MFDIKDGKLKISVRTLVEFICKSGNIDNRFKGVTDKNAMDAGSKAHRRIQKSMGSDYRAEVPFKFTVPGENYDIEIEGRADGIFENDGYVTIDEIKGTYRDIRYITEPVYVHEAQAMCYAYFYSARENVDDMKIRLTYVSLDTADVKYFEEIMSAARLKEWFDGIIMELRRWGDYLYTHHNERDESIEGLKFPFDYRPGQRELAVNVYRAVSRGVNLFIQAPTGVGKTISTVFPAVMSIGKGISDKIFYLTAKTITRTAAQDAFAILRNGGLDFKTVTVTAKDKICFLESETGPECNPAACPYAKGHNDRVNEAVYDIITHENVIDRVKVEEYAHKHNVCPFEFSLDISYWMDGVICDYNYAFDPHVYLKRFFSDTEKGDYVFLVDEAHNLVDRARQMYSASVYKEDFLSIKKLAGNYSKKLSRALDRCNRNLLEYKRACDTEYMTLDDDGDFAVNMQRLGEELTSFMEKNADFEYMKELSEFFFVVNHYNSMRDELDENYIIYTEHTERRFMLRLFCVNPAGCLGRRIAMGRSAVFFSATLLPVNYYKELLGGSREEYAVYARSPFDTDKRLLAIGSDVTSRYTRRNEAEYIRIRKYILSVIHAKTGNYLVFFPSYKYMQDVAELFDEITDNVDIMMQHQNMNEEDKEEFLGRFEANENKDKSLLGFGVMGGVFSEGIDLKNDCLIGTIIVGTGLPSINTEGELLRRYYDEKENCGYEYAYMYPGMNKVLQAAGRVIRTVDDRGIIILLDDRFLKRQYLNIFPEEWRDYRVTDCNKVEQEILDFWLD